MTGWQAVFLMDLGRMTRRGRPWLWRTLYGAALLGLLLVLTPPGGSTRPSDLAAFAEDFATGLLIVQALAVLVLTPIVVAGAIAEERQQGTLDLLRTTALADREIALGKLAARLTHLGLILLAGLPVLSLLQLFGGIDPETLWLVFGLTFLSGVALGCLALTCSAWAPDVSRALMASLGLGASGAVLLWSAVEIGQLVGFDDRWFLAALLLASIPLLVRTAVRGLSHERHGRVRRPPVPPPARKPPAAIPAPRPSAPPPEDRPMFWKEQRVFDQHFGVDRTQAKILAAWLAVLLAVVWGWELAGDLPPQQLSIPVRVAAGLFTFADLLIVAVWTAGRLGAERDRHTLDGLLTAPLTAREILAGTWRAAVFTPTQTRAFLAGAAVFGVLTGAVHPAAPPLAALVYLAVVTGVTSLGVACAVTFPRTLHAQLAAGAVTAFLGLGGPTLVGAWLPLGDVDGEARFQLGAGLCATTAVALALFHGADLDWASSPAIRLAAGTLIGPLGYAAAGWLLWEYAVWRFRRTCGRGENRDQKGAPMPERAE
jgi:ABC-type transport system involved in multi-copper enzyme maturation permease subunit